MSMEAPAGLVHFPVTKLCMVSTAMVPLIASVLSSKYVFLVKNDPFIREYYQYYRLFTFQLGAINESDVVLLMLIWYHFRHLERVMGSYKYISVVSLVFLYTTFGLAGLSLLCNAVIPWKVWDSYPSGGLPIALVLYHFYKEYTPHIYEFEVLLTKPWSIKRSGDNGTTKPIKWTLNDQFYIDFLIGLLVINQGFAGITCGFLSWLCGIFLDKGLLPGMNRWRLPLLDAYTDSNAYNIFVGLTGNPRNDGNVNNSGTTTNSNNSIIEVAVDDDDVPARSLGVQFLDTFRR